MPTPVVRPSNLKATDHRSLKVVQSHPCFENKSPRFMERRADAASNASARFTSNAVRQ
ncbi:MAG: hypothetical protein AVDCRST_MAG85-369, partial [uncultured Solirubrobacteraceae bacterium]